MTSSLLTRQAHLSGLATYLLEQHERILTAWTAAVDADPTLTTASQLSRTQFRDHIPEVLVQFAANLRRTAPAPETTEGEELTERTPSVKHGMHRWQQGYRLSEVLREWGLLQQCLVQVLNEYEAAHPEIDLWVIAQARLVVAELHSQGISQSATEYDRLRQAEVAGHVRELEQTLGVLSDLDRRRGNELRETSHDITGSLTVLHSAVQMLARPTATEESRERIVKWLHTGVSTLSRLLNDLMDLARLEAGQEQRNVALFDVAVLLRELCVTYQALAEQRGLFLNAEGSATLLVEGDAIKIHRIAQNLVLNALKYTVQGGVTVSWEDSEAAHWTLIVQDTGPGLRAGPTTPMAQALEVATMTAHELEGADMPTSDASSQALPQPIMPQSALPEQQQSMRPGEGIGLSIVKRLCELLDASLELESTPGSGSTFRVLLPRQYSSEPEL